MPTIDHYVTPLKLPMSIDLFARFPYVSAYKAEFREGHAELTYRPRLSMARLRVEERTAREVSGVTIGPLDVAANVERLAKLFALAFAHLPPMDTMAPTTRRHAADAAMQHTARGGEGKVFDRACVGATDIATGKLIGAAMVCQITLRDDEWPEPELPVRLVNLTWLFVAPDRQRRQVGGALLDAVVNALARQEVPWLVSHFPEENVPSVMFHWRSGFELVSAVARR